MQALHTAGLVHRDIKPMNIIYAEQQKRFKLIDLGACADLRSGTNYIPDESILDPTYCPPEQVQELLCATHLVNTNHSDARQAFTASVFVAATHDNLSRASSTS